MKLKGSGHDIIDYPYAKELLRRINHAVLDAQVLTDQESYEGWQAVQAELFNECKFFSIKKIFTQRKYTATRLVADGRRVFFLGFLFIVHFMGVRRMRKQSQGVAVFSVDLATSAHAGDRRIDYLYDFFQKEHIPFTEIFHSTVGVKSIKNVQTRKRSAVYIEVLQAIARIRIIAKIYRMRRRMSRVVDTAVFTDTEKQFVKQVLRTVVPHIAVLPYVVQGFAAILERSSIRAVFGIDDSRHYHALAGACKRVRIPFYAFQHGHYTPYHAGWLQAQSSVPITYYPDTLVVWSDYWKQELLRCGSVFKETDIAIGGYRDELQTCTPREHRNELRILVPYELDTRSVVAEFIQKIEQDVRVTVYLKTRPDIPEDVQRAQYGGNDVHSRLHIAPDLKGVLPQIDLVIGTFSTLLYDCLGYGKPIALLKVPGFDFGKGLVENDLAELIDGDRDYTFERLQAITTAAESRIRERRERLFGKTPQRIQNWLTTCWKDIHEKI